MSTTLIESWGSDERVIEAARQSTGGKARTWAEDAKLLQYLMRHHHTSPFEHCGATFQVTTPIFVARQWMRHRTQSYSEFSQRYAEARPVFWTPNEERLRGAPTDNKQAQSKRPFSGNAATSLQEIRRSQDSAWELYQSLLESGAPREVARTVLPLSVHTTFIASANLHNWLRFLKLRLDSHSQLEIRDEARQVMAHLTTRFPRVLAEFRAQYPESAAAH